MFWISLNLTGQSKVISIKKFIEYDLKLDRLTSLACFPTNAEDSFLTRKDDVKYNKKEFFYIFIFFVDLQIFLLGRGLWRRRLGDQADG